MRLLVLADTRRASSTLLRVLAGLAAAGGEVEIAGVRAPASGWWSRVAYLGAEPGIHAWMTPREALTLTADLHQIGGEQSSRRIDRAVAWAGISEDALDRPVKHGGRALLQRTGLAAALVGDPEVLLLDDPLGSLDPAERARLLRLPGRRRTILLSSRDPVGDRALVSHIARLENGCLGPITPADRTGASGPPSTAER